MVTSISIRSPTPTLRSASTEPDFSTKCICRSCGPFPICGAPNVGVVPQLPAVRGIRLPAVLCRSNPLRCRKRFPHGFAGVLPYATASDRVQATFDTLFLDPSAPGLASRHWVPGLYLYIGLILSGYNVPHHPVFVNGFCVIFEALFPAAQLS